MPGKGLSITHWTLNVHISQVCLDSLQSPIPKILTNLSGNRLFCAFQSDGHKYRHNRKRRCSMWTGPKARVVFSLVLNDPQSHLWPGWDTNEARVIPQSHATQAIRAYSQWASASVPSLINGYHWFLWCYSHWRSLWIGPNSLIYNLKLYLESPGDSVLVVVIDWRIMSLSRSADVPISAFWLDILFCFINNSISYNNKHITISPD